MMRQEAKQQLEQSVDLDAEYCLVGKTRLKKEERDILLKQLEQDEKYLSVPLALYFTSPFWRELKVDSNKLCRDCER